jgi:Ca2+-binding EF-hand superfamily protein
MNSSRRRTVSGQRADDSEGQAHECCGLVEDSDSRVNHVSYCSAARLTFDACCLQSTARRSNNCIIVSRSSIAVRRRAEHGRERGMRLVVSIRTHPRVDSLTPVSVLRSLRRHLSTRFPTHLRTCQSRCRTSGMHRVSDSSSAFVQQLICSFVVCCVCQSLNPMSPRILTLFQNDAGEDAINAGGVTFDIFVKTLNFFHARTPWTAKLEKLFKAYDVDGDGVISERDLQQMLKYYVGPHLSEATCRVLVRKTMQHALSRCDGDGKKKSSKDDSTPRGLSFEDFSRVVSEDGIDALNVHIPIQS